MKEIETRIINIDIEKISEKLHTINASKIKAEDQINRIYDFPDRKLLKDKGYARIRTVFDNITNKTKHYMTVKKMVSQETYKVMDEFETQIVDCNEGEKIFCSLGLVLIQTINKHRESYRYNNTLIEIDINDKNFCPFPYIEIESPFQDEIIEVVSLLGYKMEDTTSETIYEILNKGNI